MESRSRLLYRSAIRGVQRAIDDGREEDVRRELEAFDRFERGLDPEMCPRESAAASRLTPAGTSLRSSRWLSKFVRRCLRSEKSELCRLFASARLATVVLVLVDL